MASWNELREGQQLEKCPVCAALISKKRKTIHVTKCFETYKHNIDELGLTRCPLYPLHIFPKKYLNHHLEGNCEQAQNMLRKYFQNNSFQQMIKPVPEIFLAVVPDDVLNKHNKQLLYILQRDLEGKDISNDQSLYSTENS